MPRQPDNFSHDAGMVICAVITIVVALAGFAVFMARHHA